MSRDMTMHLDEPSLSSTCMPFPYPLFACLNRDTHYDVFNSLTSCLGNREVLALTQTCHRLHDQLKAPLWDVNVKLRRFFKDPIAFRSVLGQFRAIVSGSFALQFLERVIWPESDLDVIAEEGESMEGLARYLIDCEGYTFSGRQDFHSYKFERGVCENYLLGTKKVQLISAENHICPLLPVFCGYYTTAIVNFITWNAAYSVFPHATFVKHETTLSGRLMNSTSDCLRGLQDNSTWKMHLDTTCVIAPSTPDSVIDYTHFFLAPPAETPTLSSSTPAAATDGSDERRYYRVEANMLWSPVLLYKYIYYRGKRYGRDKNLYEKSACIDDILWTSFCAQGKKAPGGRGKPDVVEYHDDEIIASLRDELIIH
ncbi:hypothetical protein K402DRAFT_406259 [Aulographum hederae CBS 113979]|uniref:F-box domain-containing protein n=1 Tax=Aulographum hederae CBS 113979 TaxID=1176131 RepID=A0A6G1GU41_9PEZI|nr:hypothetical protein K402DRAFT_406259 [Aulographum hederae CBS 113979]